MTSRERVESALKHREPDRTPVFEYVLLSPLADTLLGRPYAADPDQWEGCVQELGWEQAVRRRAIDQLDLALRLGHDMMYVLPNPGPLLPDSVEETAKPEPPADPVERVQLRNEQAARETPRPPDEGFLVYEVLKAEMAQRGVDLPILAPTYHHGVWTDVDLMMTMLAAPEVAHDHFRLATRRSLGFLDKYIELCLDQVGVGGDFAGNRPLISPEMYQTYIVSELRKVSRRAREAGLWAVNASDGDLWPVIEDFLFGCEVDAYLEIDMQAGMDLGRLKESYGGRITFYGNLDCGNVLSFATPAEVGRHTRACLEAAMGNGGHILCASNAITASVPLENYLAVVATYRDMFGLPGLSAP
jgi:uroporphyrinogen decarboxylase